MTTITKEQAQKIIDAADEVITALAGTNDDVHPDNSRKMCDLWDDLNDRYAPPEVVRELARIALASLDAEPVAWECGEYIILFNPDTVEAYAKRAEISPKPLYTAPPAPAVPATLPCAVELKPGLIIGKGCKTETLLTALQRRADYYAEIDAMTPEERAEHDANIEAFKAMLPHPVPDERKAFEAFMDKRFGDTIDQSRAKNGDQGYMAWDMVVAWIVWQGRAAMLQGDKNNG